MSQQNEANYIGIETFNGQRPPKGPRVLPLYLDFTIQQTYTINLSHAEANDRIEFVQGIFCDNTANSSSISFFNRRTGQKITYPPYSYGWATVSWPNQPHVIIVSANNALVINAQLCSFPVGNCIVPVGAPGASAPSVIIGGSTGTDHSSAQPVLLANLLNTAPVNAGRSAIYVQNQSANQLQVVRDDGAGGNVSVILLAPGTGANAQGADWYSQSFKGRVRVFSSAAGDQMMMGED